MNIIRAATHTTKRGPAAYFTGHVGIEEFAADQGTSATRIVRVTFEPGARTAWHTHPHGQMLHIVSGLGRAQRAGQGVMELFPGDTVWFEPGERHWHGAASQSAMVHLAVQQMDASGCAATWQEAVSDSDYHGTHA